MSAPFRRSLSFSILDQHNERTRIYSKRKKLFSETPLFGILFSRAKIPVSRFTVQTPCKPVPYKYSNPGFRIIPGPYFSQKNNKCFKKHFFSNTLWRFTLFWHRNPSSICIKKIFRTWMRSWSVLQSVSRRATF